MANLELNGYTQRVNLLDLIRKIIGIIILGLAVLFAVTIKHLYKDFSTIAVSDGFLNTDDQLIYITRRLLYILLIVACVAFSLTLLIQAKTNRYVKVGFIIVITAWGLLELPVYKCEYNRPHSFWDSKSTHFH